MPLTASDGDPLEVPSEAEVLEEARWVRHLILQRMKKIHARPDQAVLWAEAYAWLARPDQPHGGSGVASQSVQAVGSEQTG